MTETFTNAGAGAAIISPLWLPVLHTINDVAAWSLPVLGCLWLLVQMYFKFRDRNKN
jgi:hypothetical protein